jgi:restriction alleviation protein Lar
MTGVDPKGLQICPFCGGVAKLYPQTYSEENPSEVIGPAVVNCHDCSAAVIGDWEDDALAAWNRRALSPLKGAPVAWRWRLPSDTTWQFTDGPQIPRLGLLEASAIKEPLFASQPLPETEEKGSAPFDTSISAETKAQLAAIDDNIRAAAIQAPTTFFGSGSTLPATKGVVEALRAAESELMRLRRIFLPEYEGKIGEPKAAVLAKISAALSLPAPGEGEADRKRIEQIAQDAGVADGNRITELEGMLAEAEMREVTWREQALSPTAPELGAVNALPWRDGEARTAFGSAYAVHQQADGLFVVVGCGSFVGGTHPTREAAQNAAQADYERRILSALVPLTTPDDQPQTDEMQPDKYTGGDFNGVVRGKRP